MKKDYHKTTCDYSGRTVDMLLLQFVKEPVDEVIVKPDVSKSPMITTGVEKLVQRYAILFLTQLGTVKNCENEGTEFLTLLGSGKIYDINTLRSAAAAANATVLRQIKSEDKYLDTDDDEALEYSEITETSIDRSTATVFVTVKITSVAGETYTYTTPLMTGV